MVYNFTMPVIYVIGLFFLSTRFLRLSATNNVDRALKGLQVHIVDCYSASSVTDYIIFIITLTLMLFHELCYYIVYS